MFTDVPANDIDSTNNDNVVCLPVFNSYDPNEKEVSPKGTGAAGNVPDTTNTLTYTIHFQNTGTAAALQINIKDTLDAAIDPSSLKVLSSSHAVTAQWKAHNVIQFSFANINLPDSSANKARSRAL